MKKEVYSNPLHKTAIEGAVRLLKRMAVEAVDPDLAKLVKSIEQHLTTEDSRHVTG